DGQPTLRQGDRGEQFEATGGFQQGGARGGGDQARGQLGQALVIIRDGPAVAGRQGGDVERRLRHIDPDEVFHAWLHRGNDRRGPTLRNAGSHPGQLFGLSAING